MTDRIPEQVIEGTWDEIRQHAGSLVGSHLRLEVYKPEPADLEEQKRVARKYLESLMQESIDSGPGIEADEAFWQRHFAQLDQLDSGLGPA